jgi:hypothetical protein
MKKNIKKQPPLPQPPKMPAKQTFYEKTNQWIKKYDWYFLGIGLFFTFLFGLLLFDPFINEAGDDTSYVERAYRFLYHGAFPGFQGALYPMVLSLIVLISGINVIILKGSSLVFLMLSILFLFLAFRKHIDAVLNVFIVLMTALSGAVLFYGSQTFNEAFYMFVQSLSIFVFVKYYVSNPPTSIRQQIISAMWMGLLVFLMTITKHIGVVTLLAVLATLLVFKQWRDAIFNVASFVFFYVIFAIIKKLFWGIPFVERSSQGSVLMQKNPYNPGDGMEDLAGYISRLFENANLYISQHFYQFANLRETVTHTQPIIWLTVITVIIWLAALWKAYQNKDKTTTFVGFYTAFFLGITFIVLQTFWKQDRLILPVFPLGMFLFVYAFAKWLDWKKRTVFAVLGLIFMVSLLFISLQKVTVNSQDRKPQRAYFRGNDRVFTYTQDWKNYLLMSQWAADNTSDTSIIAARKCSMSNIFSGKFKFWGIYRVPVISYESIPKPPDTYVAVLMHPQLVIAHWPELTKNIMAVIHTTEHIALETGGQTMNVFGLYHIPESKKADLNRLRAIGFPFTEDADNWIQQNALKDGVSIYSPEELLQTLKSNRVDHVLMASLRLNPRDASAGIISTVNRYIFYITMKYPNFMGPAIHTIGATDPASLHPLNYD